MGKITESQLNLCLFSIEKFVRVMGLIFLLCWDTQLPKIKLSHPLLRRQFHSSKTEFNKIFLEYNSSYNFYPQFEIILYEDEFFCELQSK